MAADDSDLTDLNEAESWPPPGAYLRFSSTPNPEDDVRLYRIESVKERTAVILPVPWWRWQLIRLRRFVRRLCFWR